MKKLKSMKVADVKSMKVGRRYEAFTGKTGDVVRKTTIGEEVVKARSAAPTASKSKTAPNVNEVAPSLKTFEKIDGAIVPINQVEKYMKTKATKEAAKKAAVKSETKVAAKPATVKKARAGAYAPTDKIKVIAKSNPKREGSIQYKRFAATKTGMTVEAAAKHGVDTATLRGWEQQGHVTVG